MRTKLKTAPTDYPLELDDIKQHLNITVGWTEDDDYLDALLAVATTQAEGFTRRRFITQTWYYYLDQWPDEDYIVLPYGNLQASPALSVTYTDTDYDDTIWPATNYNADTNVDPGRVILEYDDTYPTDTLSPENPIVVEYTCGYGDDHTDVDPMIKHALKIIIGDLYSNRESIIVGTIHQKMGVIEDLLTRFRLPGTYEGLQALYK